MSEPQRKIEVLLVEDSHSDALLLVHQLEQSGFAVNWNRVETEPEFLEALDPPPDIILCDYSLPQFGAMRALEICQGARWDIPFLIVSGSIGEEIAVDAMKAGATDYLRKDRLHRIGQAVIRSLESRDLRRGKRRAEELVYLRERAIEASNQGMMIVDAISAERPVIFVNPAISEITGYTADELLGRTWTCFEGPSTNPAVVTRLIDAFRAGRSCSADLVCYHKDGTEVPAEISISPIRDALSGKVSHYVGILTNATERTQLFEQFLQSQKMEAVGRLASGVAHDFNNLLTGMLGYSDLILSRLLKDDPLYSDVIEIRRGAERAAALTHQLLTFSRKQVIAPRILDLNQVVLNLERMLRRLIGENIHLVTKLDPHAMAIQADPGQIEQVILNISVNARDAMSAGGTITISTRKTSSEAVSRRVGKSLSLATYTQLSISDTGCGMDEQVRQRIFEPFFTTKQEGRGTGLGLSTVYGVLKQSGGEIALDTAVGKGTTFDLYFPSVANHTGREESGESAVPNSSGTESILLVEDDSMLRQLCERILRKQGYAVQTAKDGVDALDWLNRQSDVSIDLLVTDVVMPRLNGRRLAETLHQSRPALKVLYISGYTDDSSLIRDLAANESHFLQKPFSPNALCQRVRVVLDQ